MNPVNNLSSNEDVFVNPYHPKSWGPSFWRILHTIAGQYPDQPSTEEKTAMEQFLGSLVYLIPCDKCREHYKQYIHTNPPQTQTGTSLRQWILWLHNQINTSTRSGKSWTMAELEAQYPPKTQVEAWLQLQESEIKSRMASDPVFAQNIQRYASSHTPLQAPAPVPPKPSQKPSRKPPRRRVVAPPPLMRTPSLGLHTVNETSSHVFSRGPLPPRYSGRRRQNFKRHLQEHKQRKKKCKTCNRRTLPNTLRNN